VNENTAVRAATTLTATPSGRVHFVCFRWSSSTINPTG